MSLGYVTPAGPLRAVVAALIAGGVRDVVICPGSRSTPLALALRVSPELHCWVHLDERAGAFFALGAARASHRPAAILATSGTAVVNLSPAVTEARYGRVPLIVLTADRPPELQDVGAPQTIDQRELYGRHAKWYAELPVPEATPDAEAHARAVVTRAIAVATASPAGPVQLDFPFREPLLPQGSLVSATVRDAGTAEHGDPPAKPVEPMGRADALGSELQRATEHIERASRGLIVCGPLDEPGFPKTVSRLASVSGFPVVADVLSGVRSGGHDRAHVIAHHDLLLRSARFREQYTPDLVIRFGARPTSRTFDEWLDGLDVLQLLVDDGNGWNRSRVPTLVVADPVSFARSASEVLGKVPARPSDWLGSWQLAEARAAHAVDGWMATLHEPFEGAVATALSDALPDGTVVLAGNSMPVRDLDTFTPTTPRLHRYLGNRGANGIDGLLSTALGLAAGGPPRVVAVVGDLSFLHDLTALLAARRLDLQVTIVVIDNDGGGIFSFLPQADAPHSGIGLPEHFEELFGTPHGIELGPVVEALGARHQAVDPGSLRLVLRAAVDQPGVDVLHLKTERARNVTLHREVYAAVVAALESGI